jgi:hypothetical protein
MSAVLKIVLQEVWVMGEGGAGSGGGSLPIGSGGEDEVIIIPEPPTVPITPTEPPFSRP